MVNLFLHSPFVSNFSYIYLSGSGSVFGVGIRSHNGPELGSNLDPDPNPQYWTAVWRIRIILILIRIRIQDVKKFVTDPSKVNFDTDPDPGKINTDPDPGKISTDPDPAKRTKYQENLKKGMKNAQNLCFVGVNYFTIACL